MIPPLAWLHVRQPGAVVAEEASSWFASIIRTSTDRQIYMNIDIIKNTTDWPLKPSRVDFVLRLQEWLRPHEDIPEAIAAAIDYALSDQPGRGGAVLIGRENSHCMAACVVNRTGMSLYVPENALVYLAVAPSMRDRGFERKMIEAVLAEFPGDFMLHVEENNPARSLYERLGFEPCYLEMRLNR